MPETTMQKAGSVARAGSHPSLRTEDVGYAVGSNSRGASMLQTIRSDVEAADCFRLSPRDLLDLVVRLQEATLAAIDDAEHAGTRDTTLERLHPVWRDMASGRRSG